MKREETVKIRKAFSITHGKGFQMTFANGWTISVQWGPGNYCDHYDAHTGGGEFMKLETQCGAEGSRTAECAAIDPNNELVKHPGSREDTVSARRTPDEVLELMNWVAKQPR